jgi:hypothetical protein
MKVTKIPSIRLDKTNVDAPTINRALDNIISNVNTLATNTAAAIDALEGQAATGSGVQDIQAGTGISVAESPPGTFTITNTAPGSGSVNVVGGTGISVVESPTDTFTVTNTGALLSGPAQTFTNSNTFNGAVTLGAGQTFTNNGTIAGGTVNATTYQNLPVDDIQAGSGILVTESPSGTFTIVNTAQGGGGGGGVIYYLNEAISGDAPVPVVGTKEFGPVIQPAGSTTGPIAINDTAYTTINTFITDLNVPNVTVIPAGIWDFNIWMACDSANPGRVFAEIRLFTWDGTTTTPIGSSVPTFITNHSNISQYSFAVIVPQTTVAATDRIYAVLEARTTNGNHTITAYYGDGEPSHAHSTIPFPYVQNILSGTAINVVQSPTGTYTVNNTSPDQIVTIAPGTAISVTGTYPNFTVTNTSPDQTVSLTPGTGINVTGTYPNFTITNSAPDQVVAIASGTAISVTGTYPSFNVANTAPDQIVAIASGAGINVTGTYPSFTVTNTDPGSAVSVTGGTGVTVTGGPTYSVAIGQPVGTTDDVTFDDVTATRLISTIYTSNSTILVQPIASAAAPFQVQIVAGQTTAPATVGAAVSITGGGAVSQGGDVIINGGAATTTQGAVSIGTGLSTRVVAIGRTGIFTNVSGSLNVVGGVYTSGASIQLNPQAASGTGFTTQIRGGTSTTTTGGTLSLDGGTGVGTNGIINIGTSLASALTIGRSGVTTTMNGTVNAAGFNLSLPSWASVTAPGSVSLSTSLGGGISLVSGNVTLATSGGLTLKSGTNSGGDTGTFLAGTGNSTSAASGGVAISSGSGVTSTGAVSLSAGNASAGTGGAVSVFAGAATGSTGDGGKINIRGGASNATTGTAGDVEIVAGNANGASGTAGNVIIDAGAGPGVNDGVVSIGLGVNTPGGTTKEVNIGTNTVLVNIPCVVGTYGYALGSSANTTVPGSGAPLTLTYNSSDVDGISINNGTGIITVPATGLYRISFTAVFRVFTNLASTWWTNWQFYNVTAGVALENFPCFKLVATSGNATAYALNDSFAVNLNTILTLSTASTYAMRAYNSTAAGNLVVAWEPTLTSVNTSRPGVRYRLQIERVN